MLLQDQLLYARVEVHPYSWIFVSDGDDLPSNAFWLPVLMKLSRSLALFFWIRIDWIVVELKVEMTFFVLLFTPPFTMHDRRTQNSFVSNYCCWMTVISVWSVWMFECLLWILHIYLHVFNMWRRNSKNKEYPKIQPKRTRVVERSKAISFLMIFVQSYQFQSLRITNIFQLKEVLYLHPWFHYGCTLESSKRTECVWQTWEQVHIYIYITMISSVNTHISFIIYLVKREKYT